MERGSKNDKDVFIEKPYCLSLRDAQKLSELATDKNKVLMVGHLLNYHNAFVKMKELINIGFIDSFRLMNPHVKDYSFWDYQGGAWQKDNGIRIDFFLTSPEIVDRLLFAGIDKNPRGKEKPSDHTPIWIELEDK